MDQRKWLFWIGVLCSGELTARPSAQKMSLLDFCTEQNQPTFIFQNLWTDSVQPGKRRNEFWVDRDQEIIRAYWWTKGDKPIFLVGSQMSEKDFYLCSYRLGQKKPTGAFTGRALPSGIHLESIDKKKTFSFAYSPVLSESRSYSLRYENRSIKHQIIGKIPSDRPFTCDTTVSSFQLVPHQASREIENANRRIMELAQAIQWDKETSDCQNPKNPPFVKAMGINLMFANDRFLSVKMDFAQIHGLAGHLQGKTLNLDIMKQSELSWDSIVLPADQKVLLKEVNQRIREAYGEGAKVEGLADCNFSFNSQTLVVSAAPQGLFEDRVDIPIPLDHMFGVLKIKPHGPLAQP